MSLAIETKDLCYSFAYKKNVVDRLSLQVPEGSIFGFLGPNGAGKTTTMRLLTGLLRTEKDNVFLNGQSLKKSIPQVFENIGTLIETPSLYLHLSAVDNLKIITTLRNLPADSIEKVLAVADLEKDAKRKVKEYSLGMKQRLAIAMALLPDPKMILLDEPANGLDPAGIIEIRELLMRLNREEGKTVFVSSHILSEVEKMCTHVAIIHQGVLRFQGSLQELKQSAANKEVSFTLHRPEQWRQTVSEHWPGAKWKNYGPVISVQTEEEIADINTRMVQLGVPVVSIHPSGGLEEWFVHLTQN